MKSKNIKSNILGYSLLAPWLFGFFFLFLIPMAMSLYYSFTNYNMMKAPQWIGLDNYARLLTDEDFWNSLFVTFRYAFLLVPLRLAFALAVAMILAKKYRGNGVYRTLYYIPSVIGGSVAVSIIWKQLFGNPGVLMTFMTELGFAPKQSLIGNEDTALYVLVLLGVWQFGSAMLIFLAALKQVPFSLYEAAEIDGISPWKRFTRITLPLISPTIFFNLILQIIGGFKSFNEGYIITQGGPDNSTMFYVINLYNRAFKYFEMGYSSALAWVLVVIVTVLSAIVFATQNKWVYYENKGGK